MANDINTSIQIFANKKTTKIIDNLFKNSGSSIDDLKQFIDSFYPNREVKNKNAIDYDQIYDNIDAKWIYTADHGGGFYQVVTGWTFPKKFINHLYDIMTKTDSEAYIEATFQSENFNPVGCFIIKKNKDAKTEEYLVENEELEYPDSDDEEAMEEFNDLRNEIIADVYDDCKQYFN